MFGLTLIGIGRLKSGPERDLVARYLQRAEAAGRSLGIAVESREIDESRALRPADRKRDEAHALSALVPAGSAVMVLDETGRPATSRDFAALVGAARDAGVAGMTVVIGGPDGCEPQFRARANHVVAFGAMTWPHQLVRVMAAEQIYRAITILAGHPYHRD